MKGEEPREIVERLTAIGLDEREAKLYVDVLLHGPSRASDAAARVRLKRTETYRALEGLMKQGFVKAHLTRPVAYEAVAPEVVFHDILAAHDQRRGDMEKLRERVGRIAQDARARKGEAEGRYAYKMIQGRRAILAAVESMLRSAREGQWMASSHFGPASATAQNRAFQLTIRRAEAGLPMKLLFREQPGLDRVLAPLASHPRVEIRLADLALPVRFTIVDDREIMFWLVSDPAAGVEARDDVAMWTNAPDFIAAQRALFSALWEHARPTPRMAPRDVRIQG